MGRLHIECVFRESAPKVAMRNACYLLFLKNMWVFILLKFKKYLWNLVSCVVDILKRHIKCDRCVKYISPKCTFVFFIFHTINARTSSLLRYSFHFYTWFHTPRESCLPLVFSLLACYPTFLPRPSSPCQPPHTNLILPPLFLCHLLCPFYFCNLIPHPVSNPTSRKLFQST